MMDELDNLPRLLQLLAEQTFAQFALYVCVNQPDSWWTDGQEAHRAVCERNAATMDLLLAETRFPIEVLDCSSLGRGWQGKKTGVGWARKLLFESIASHSDDDELLVSLDADTDFDADYLQQVLDTMNAAPSASVLSVPYYHPLCGDAETDRPLLRYECYMRYYLVSLLERENPYAFSALGSAMVFPLWAYRRVGGITPLQGGEDFYLMQKFCKTGRVLLNTCALVRPQGRQSARVPFGTGPAVMSGLARQAERYPFFAQEGFDRVAETYALFPALYDADLPTPMSIFLQEQLKTDDLWAPLRKNFRTKQLFVKACAERVDGLRILQYLKRFPVGENNFVLFMQNHGESLPGFSFSDSDIHRINQVRDHLFRIEMHLRGVRI